MRNILPVIAAAFFAASPAAADSFEELLRAAKAEGQLTVAGVTRDWCRNGAQLDNFKAKFGIPIVELSSDSASGEIIEAVRANKDNSGPQAADVVEVGQSFAALAKADNLLQPYRVATWASIPITSRTPRRIGPAPIMVSWSSRATVRSSAPPADWADLSQPVFKNSVALQGDPARFFQRDPGGLCIRPLARRRGCGEGGGSRAGLFRRTCKK